MLYINPKTMSPDPLDAMKHKSVVDDFYAETDLFPHALEAHNITSEHVAAWGRSFDLFKRPASLTYSTDARNHSALIIDFGAELEANLELELTVDCCSNVYVVFGESLFEAEMLGAPGTIPEPVEHWHIPHAGKHKHLFSQRGFRFVKISTHDAKEITLHHVVAHALFAFYKGKIGTFSCSDEKYQRVWQTSVYTARLCSRPNEYWDGIKRDRLGWYGDARITQLTTDSVFLDPTPALQMLNSLSTDVWANYTPTYSFDAVAMLRQSILVYGAEDPIVRDIFQKIIQLLAWCKRTQTLENGLFKRDDTVRYDYGVGFIDWSPMPLGGRMEEISWIQMKYLEALKNAAYIAEILHNPSLAAQFATDAAQLEKSIIQAFWRPEKGFIHTQNRVIDDFKMSWEVDHFTKSYIDGIKLGESGTSRHSSSLAVWCLAPQDTFLQKSLQVLNDETLTKIITGYFAFYEQSARAACGDSLGAFHNMRDYIGDQLEQHDSSTVWESYEPLVRDFRKWGLQSFPKSLCHAWSSGTVPITTKYMLGVTPTAPGFRAVSLAPETRVPWSFEAKVPTPHGVIYVAKGLGAAPVEYQIPNAISVVGEEAMPASVKVAMY
ncbi:MAG: hypothetical protein WCL54_08610 [Clostridia bacterium]